ncbi:Proton-coupled folate transporter, partial [Stegodyphus mimosarum]
MTAKGIYSRIKDALKKTTVEPYMFLVMFAFNARLVTLQSLLHDRACRVVLNFSSETCDGLEDENNNKEQLLAISYGNDIYTGTVLMSTIPALVIASFLGPWSDRYSRKYPLLMATAGILIDSTLQTIITSFSKASPYWFIASSAVSGFSGGLVIVISSTYSYMSDITDERSRNVRFAILEFFTIMATPTGSLVGGQVYDKYGYLPVMLIVPCSLTLALLWVRLYVLETKPKRFDITKKEMFMDVLRYDNMKKSFKTCIKERPGNLRMQIWLLLFTSFSLRLIHMGSIAIGFSYTRKVFKWVVT